MTNLIYLKWEIMSFCENSKVIEKTFEVISKIKKTILLVPFCLLFYFLTQELIDSQLINLNSIKFVSKEVALFAGILLFLSCLLFLDERIHKYYIRKYGVCKPILFIVLSILAITSINFYININYANPPILARFLIATLILIKLNDSKFNHRAGTRVFLFKYLSLTKFNELFNINGKGIYFDFINDYVKYNMMFIDENNLIIIPEYKDLFVVCTKNDLSLNITKNWVYGKRNVKRLIKHLESNHEINLTFELINELTLKSFK